MVFSEIVNSNRPIEQLVRLALAAKGVTVTTGTVDRYASLLEAAILADDGESLDGNVWQDFVAGIDASRNTRPQSDPSRIRLGRPRARSISSWPVSNATIDALTGRPMDEAEQSLPKISRPSRRPSRNRTAHLDDESRVVSMEVDRALGAPDPSRPEPSHIASEDRRQTMRNEMLQWSFTLKGRRARAVHRSHRTASGRGGLPVITGRGSGCGRGCHPAQGRDDEGASAGARSGC